MTIFDQMVDELPFNRRELSLLIATAPRRYKLHTIEKRNGRGKRLIAQPTAEVKVLQRWLIDNVLAKLPIHQCATAYRKGGSIVRHATPHAGARYLLKLDFADFFPSIAASALEMHMAQFAPDYTKIEVELMKRILFRHDNNAGEMRLSIGAPSSPSLSNTLLFAFDERVHQFCLKNKVRYTRYADDLAFSTDVPKKLDAVHSMVDELCRQITYPRLRLNEGKTVNVSKKHHRELTGVVLANSGRISIGRTKRRLIRAMIDRFAKRLLSPGEIARLRGLIAFSESIDPSIIDLVTRRLSDEQMLELNPGFAIRDKGDK